MSRCAPAQNPPARFPSWPPARRGAELRRPRWGPALVSPRRAPESWAVARLLQRLLLRRPSMAQGSRAPLLPPRDSARPEVLRVAPAARRRSFRAELRKGGQAAREPCALDRKSTHL